MQHDVAAATPALSSALARGDAAAAAALYAADGRVLTPAAELIAGRAEIEAYWRTGLAVGLAEVELQTLELQLGTGIAVEFGRYLLAPAAGAREEGKYVVLHRQEADGSWRRLVDVYNPDAPDEARPHSKEEP
jgi:uncharacterized protein (TIGR02246 family)